MCTGNENSKPIWNKFIIRKYIIETSQVVLNFCRTVYIETDEWEIGYIFETDICEYEYIEVSICKLVTAFYVRPWRYINVYNIYMKLIWSTLVIKGRPILLNPDNHFMQRNMPNILDKQFSQNQWSLSFTASIYNSVYSS